MWSSPNHNRNWITNEILRYDRAIKIYPKINQEISLIVFLLFILVDDLKVMLVKIGIENWMYLGCAKFIKRGGWWMQRTGMC